MINSIRHFVAVWDSETASTLSCLNNLTDESLGSNLVQDYRTIDRLINHIVDCAASIPAEAGFPVEVPAITIDRRCGSAQSAVSYAAAPLLPQSPLKQERPPTGSTPPIHSDVSCLRSAVPTGR